MGRHHNDEKVLAEFRQENDELVTAVLARNKEKAIQISQSGWDSSIKIMADSLKG
ncbi:hypothetical protein [Legionella anisa]|uniref:hypothetical protein n=1 Tax=Legionella anisa TaxID=28082 RepID=UPI001F5F1D1C|nr:hypothetical protein [Legionella anisa]